MPGIEHRQTGYHPFKKTQRNRQRNQDVRVLLRRAALRQAQSEPSLPISVDSDRFTCEQLFDDHFTAPIVQASKQLIKTKTNRQSAQGKTDKQQTQMDSLH